MRLSKYVDEEVFLITRLETIAEKVLVMDEETAKDILTELFYEASRLNNSAHNQVEVVDEIHRIYKRNIVFPAVRGIGKDKK